MTTETKGRMNYQKSLIYAIRVRGTKDIIYIDSTTDLNKRRCAHKKRWNNVNNTKSYNLDIYKHIRSIGGWEMIIFEEVKKFPCNTKAELNQEEGNVIKEYLEAGHKLKNKDKTNVHKAIKIACPCGGSYTKAHEARHNGTARHLKYIQSLPPSTEPATPETKN